MKVRGHRLELAEIESVLKSEAHVPHDFKHLNKLQKLPGGRFGVWGLRVKGLGPRVLRVKG